MSRPRSITTTEIGEQPDTGRPQGAHIILMVGDVSDIYVTNFGKMMNRMKILTATNWTPSPSVTPACWKRATMC